MKRISFILLTLLFLVSCSNDINDAYERSISYHITQDDITSIDGKLTLAFSYEEALKKGISEADYLKAEMLKDPLNMAALVSIPANIGEWYLGCF